MEIEIRHYDNNPGLHASCSQYWYQTETSDIGTEHTEVWVRWVQLANTGNVRTKIWEYRIGYH